MRPAKAGHPVITNAGVYGIAPVKPGDDEKERRLTIKSSDPLDEYIDAAAEALALPVKDAWKPAVKANLEVSLRLARLVDEFALSDETEPASVFAA
jgi:1-carboxybiuret hydrolase subunit AtzG-like protein